MNWGLKPCMIQSKSLKTVTLLAIAAGVKASCEAKIIREGTCQVIFPPTCATCGLTASPCGSGCRDASTLRRSWFDFKKINKYNFYKNLGLWDDWVLEIICQKPASGRRLVTIKFKYFSYKKFYHSEISNNKPQSKLVVFIFSPVNWIKA